MTTPQRSLAASRHNKPVMYSFVRAGFWRAGCAPSFGRPHAKKPRLIMKHYQPCRTKRTCRNAERPHTETAPKQPLSRRAGEIKSRWAAPAGSEGPQGPQPEEADQTSKGRPGGHQIKRNRGQANNVLTRPLIKVF